MKGSVRLPARTSTASPPLLAIAIATALAGAPTCADTLRAQEPFDPAVEFPGANQLATVLGLTDADDLAALPRLRVNPSPLVSVDPQTLGAVDHTALTSARVLPSGGVAILDRRARRLLVVGPDGELRADTRALESELEGAELLGLLPGGAAVVRGRRPQEAAPEGRLRPADPASDETEAFADELVDILRRRPPAGRLRNAIDHTLGARRGGELPRGRFRAGRMP